MKKIIALMIAVVLCASCLSGCYKLQLVPTNTKPTTEAVAPTTEATEPTTEATEPTTEATEPTTEATEPTTEATEPTSGNPPAGEMSDDPFGFQISVNGTVLQLPCKVSDFAAMGLLMEEKKRDNTLDEGYSSSSNLFDGEEWSNITVTIYNNTDEPMLYEDAMVDSVSFSPRGAETEYDVRICGGIGVGSTEEDVKRVFGEPARTSSESEIYGSIYYTMYYENTANGLYAFRQKIEFEMKDGVVYNFRIDSDGEYQR